MNNIITLNMRPNTSHRGFAVKSKPSAAAARVAEGKVVDMDDPRSQQLRHDWRMLASEWRALTGALKQFEEELNCLEKSFDRRLKRRAGAADAGQFSFHYK